MEQGHPIPRQITTFEFKLIGFLTLRQFIYLVIFIPAGYLTFLLFPIPFLNIVLGIIVAIIGPALAFVPINDRPLDIWVKNLIKRLNSPTQYFYKKQNSPLYFLEDLVLMSDPHKIFSHIESQRLLNNYLSQKKQVTDFSSNQQVKKRINKLLNSPSNLNFVKKEKKYNETAFSKTKQSSLPKRPFLTGVVKNKKMIPLSGILIYIKDQNGKILRLLKTNPYGVFATFNPLKEGDYIFELKDPQGSYFFDTIKLKLESQNVKPLEFFSKELL